VDFLWYFNGLWYFAFVCWCLWSSTSLACFPTLPSMVRHVTVDTADWSSASVVNLTIVTNTTIRQPGFDRTRWHGLCLTVSGQITALVVQTCTNVILPNHRHATVSSSRPWTILLTRVHAKNVKVDCSYSTRLKKMHLVAGMCNDPTLQQSRNKMKWKSHVKSRQFIQVFQWFVVLRTGGLLRTVYSEKIHTSCLYSTFCLYNEKRIILDRPRRLTTLHDESIHSHIEMFPRLSRNRCRIYNRSHPTY